VKKGHFKEYGDYEMMEGNEARDEHKKPISETMGAGCTGRTGRNGGGKLVKQGVDNCSEHKIVP